MRYKIDCGIVPPNDRPELINTRNKHHHTSLRYIYRKRSSAFPKGLDPYIKRT